MAEVSRSGVKAVLIHKERAPSLGLTVVCGTFLSDQLHCLQKGSVRLYTEGKVYGLQQDEAHATPKHRTSAVFGV